MIVFIILLFSYPFTIFILFVSFDIIHEGKINYEFLNPMSDRKCLKFSIPVLFQFILILLFSLSCWFPLMPIFCNCSYCRAILNCSINFPRHKSSIILCLLITFSDSTKAFKFTLDLSLLVFLLISAYVWLIFKNWFNIAILVIKNIIFRPILHLAFGVRVLIYMMLAISFLTKIVDLVIRS